MPRFNLLNKFRDNTSGASAIEFGILGPTFLLLLMGIFEVGMILVSQNALDTAARMSTRFAITGNVGDQATRDASIKSVAQQYSFGFLDPAKMVIVAKTYNDLTKVGSAESFVDANANGKYDLGEAFTDTNGNGQWDADVGLPSYGAGDSLVFYTISYDWALFTPLVGLAMGLQNGVIKLQATHAVMDEPF
jgi:Flp pilus assembly protein TadG